MIVVILFIALNAIYIGGLLWCILAIRKTTEIGAEVLDLHTDALRRHDAEIKALRESLFPRYTGAVVALPVDAPECGTPDWQAHDDRVSHAIAHPVPHPRDAAKLADNAVYGKQGWVGDAVSAYPVPLNTDEALGALREHLRGGGVPMTDPESAPFFTQSQPEK